MKNFGLFLVALSFSIAVSAQTMKDLVQPSEVPIVWLGIDFSHAKLIGDFSHFNGAGAGSAQVVRDTYFPAWNEILFNEAKKYKVREMLRKEKLEVDLSAIEKLNAATPLEGMEAFSAKSFTPEQLNSFVKAYSSKAQTAGLGVGYIAECLDKTQAQATYYFFVINLETKELLEYYKVVGPAGGFGLKNFWARTLLVSNKKVGKQWKKWKKTYAAKD